MKKSLIAIAAAGLVASGAAAAESYALNFDNGNVRAYAVQHDWRYDNDRWNDRRDDGRRFSIDERQGNIRDRIQRGIDNGRLTPPEARRMLRELNDVQAKERAFESDGRLGRRERDELNADLDRLNDQLRRQLRDDDRRW